MSETVKFRIGNSSGVINILNGDSHYKAGHPIYDCVNRILSQYPEKQLDQFVKSELMSDIIVEATHEASLKRGPLSSMDLVKTADEIINTQ